MAGSRPGERRGGRRKGTPNKAKVEQERKLAEVYERARAELRPKDILAMSPLDVMLHAMTIAARSENWPVAAAMAKEAAPYIHPKLTAATLDARFRRSPSDFTDDELLALESARMGDDGTDETTGLPN